VIASRLSAPDCDLIEEENLRPVALKLQQTINRIWRNDISGEFLNKGLPVVNFAGQQEVNEEYLYGP
jgi:hypothetical protein